MIRSYAFIYSFIKGSIIIALKNRFKEFRVQRTKKPKLEIPTITAQPPVAVARKQHKTWSQLPDIPEGEDQLSFQRFSSQLREEHKRKQPRMAVVEPLMDTTFPQRRRDIMTNVSHISKILEKYPFMGLEVEVKGY